MAIKLGSKVRDSITGYTGIVIGRTEWLYGCARLVVQSQDLKDGKPVESQSFDEQQCEVLEVKEPFLAPESDAAKALAKTQTKTKPGGPRATPTRRADPTR